KHGGHPPGSHSPRALAARSLGERGRQGTRGQPAERGRIVERETAEGEEETMNYDIIEALSQIAREKGVDLQVLKDRVEASLLSAARKKHGANAQITVRFDEAKGGIEMFMTKTVVGKVSDRGLEITSPQARAYKADASVGDDVIIPLDVEEFGRNAILAAKQVLIQGVREAERERVYT